MKPIIEFQNVSYWYPDADNLTPKVSELRNSVSDKSAIKDVNLKIEEGEFILITGSSGSGKSTLCKCINGIVPKFSGGKFKGRVIVDGMDTMHNPTPEIAKHAGVVFQDPENQIVMNTVENEIAFGLENLQFPEEIIEKRIQEILEYAGISDLRYRKTCELSGGEKQRIVVASVLAMHPKILVLDEPLSQIDFESANQILQIIRRLNEELGITILIAEHRANRITEFADRIFDMDKKGYIMKDEITEHPEKNSKFCARRIPTGFLCQISQSEIRAESEPLGSDSGKKIEKNNNELAIEIENLSFSYSSGSEVLKNINLKIYSGESVAIIGHNGSGKTTLVKHFNGLLKPKKGSIRIFGRETGNCKVEELAKIVGYVPQNPNELLFSDTVIDELNFTLRNLNVSGNPDEILNELSLTDYRLSYPRDLSGGQRQRVAIASVAVANQKVILLDEPTRGMDPESRKRLSELLKKIQNDNRTIILATHDMELVAESADRVVAIRNGEIISDRKNE